MELEGWKGWYDPEGDIFEEKVVNEFKLRIIRETQKGEKHVHGDVNAMGCCERIGYVSEGKYRRFYDYGTMQGKEGYSTVHRAKTIEKDIKTIEDLAAFLIEYALSSNVDEWVKDCIQSREL